MVRTNILVEVDDRVNDLVVIPHKRNKSFSKLIASLLQGYVEDEYVRAYADGTIDEMRKASVDVLDEALNSMSASLSNMGMLNAEMKATSQRGIKHFGAYAEQKEEEVRNNGATDEELTELKSTVDDLKSQNVQILQMLQQLASGGVSQPQVQVVQPAMQVAQPVQQVVAQPVVQPVQQVQQVAQPMVQPVQQVAQPVQQVQSMQQVVTQPVVQEVQPVVEEPEEVVETPKVQVVEENSSSPTVVDDFEDEDEDMEINANALLNSLMSGNQYAF